MSNPQISDKLGLGRPLTGARCYCRSCGGYFNSVSTFDRHRYGNYSDFGRNRRCRTPAELLARGWAINSAGFWVERLRSDVASRRDDQGGPGQRQGVAA